ncbi:hypothetical protein ACUXV3_01380 [Roseobacteraceae bacterium NS-SX3]
MKPHALLFGLALATQGASLHADPWDGLLACLQEAPFERLRLGESSAVLDCMLDFSDYCYDQGESLLDYPPETECFSEASRRFDTITAGIRADAAKSPDDAGLKLRSAALKRAARVTDADCDYFQEISARPGTSASFEKWKYGQVPFQRRCWSVLVHCRAREVLLVQPRGGEAPGEAARMISAPVCPRPHMLPARRTPASAGLKI